MKQTTLIEILGLVGSLASVLTAVDYYVIRSGIAVAPVPVWVVALVFGPISAVALYVALRMRSELSSHAVRLLASDAGSVMNFVRSRGLLVGSRSLDAWLYTAETLLNPLRAHLEGQPTPLQVRVLVRRPECDSRKREVAEGSLATALEIAQVNPNVDLDVHFYNDDPLLRLQVYDSGNGVTCLGGIYRHDSAHPMRFVGAEENRMLILANQIPDQQELIRAFRSRFDELWSRTSALRAVLFDLDGVLVDSMEEHYRTWRGAFEAAGVSTNVDAFRLDVYRLEGCTADDTVHDLYLKYMGRPPEPSMVSEIVAAKARSYAAVADDLSAFDGIDDVLAHLRSRQVPTALVSGSPPEAVHKIVARLFPGMFDVVISGSDVSVGKPHPAAYRAAITSLRLRDTASCVAVENSPLGVRSATAAELLVYGMLRNSPLSAKQLLEAGALRVFAGPEELLHVLKDFRYAGLRRHAV